MMTHFQASLMIFSQAMLAIAVLFMVMTDRR